MKKSIALLLALTLCLGLVACAPSDLGATDASTESTALSAETDASESTGASEETLQTDATDATDGTDAADGTDATDATASSEATDATDATQGTTAAEPTNGSEATQPTKPTEPEPELEGTVYTKVEPGKVKEGFYLLGGTSAYGTDDGTKEGFISGIFDSKGTRLTAKQLTVVGSKIANEDKNMVWQFISASGGFYVKNAGTGRYLYYGSQTGNAIFDTASKSQAGVWKVVSHDDAWTLEEVASGRQISLNAFGSEGSKYLGAAAYGSTGSSARSLVFYCLTKGSVTPNAPAPDPTEPTEKPTEMPTEKPTEAPQTPTTGDSGEVTYVLNTKTKKYHKPTCRYADNKNREDTTKSKAELEADGYEACKVCKP